MTATQNDVAAQYRSLLDDAIATVDRCSEEQWRAQTTPEAWSVGVVAHHIASTQQFLIELMQNVINGTNEPMSLSMEMIHAGNAEHAREFANVGKAETLAMLRDGAPRAVTLIEQLSDEQLNATAAVFSGQPMTLAQSIQAVALGHFPDHIASINATIQQ
jgi:hypothetical protein